MRGVKSATSTPSSRIRPAIPRWPPGSRAVAANTYELSKFLVDVFRLIDVGAISRIDPPTPDLPLAEAAASR